MSTGDKQLNTPDSESSCDESTSSARVRVLTEVEAAELLRDMKESGARIQARLKSRSKGDEPPNSN